MRLTDFPQIDHSVPDDARAVVAFWRDAGPGMWFATLPEFDATFREHFLDLHEAAARGHLAHWEASAYGALALLILLDQFPRNAFRGNARMYATDELAVLVAARALDRSFDAQVSEALAIFFYLPFSHSECLADQDLAVQLAAGLHDPIPEHAKRHRDTVQRFGRFPQRNATLQRQSTTEEQAFLDCGAYI